MTSLLLLSGGLDSTTVAALVRPAGALFVDYGQAAAGAEFASAKMVAAHLDLRFHTMAVDLSPIGMGLMVGGRPTDFAPTPEWFPYRNQHLIGIAAHSALSFGYTSVVLGIVGGDGERHADGSPGFVEAIDRLLRLQEGGISVEAPHIDDDPSELLQACGLPENVVRRTHSCHSGNLGCGQCPGCLRRIRRLAEMYL